MLKLRETSATVQKEKKIEISVKVEEILKESIK